MFSLRRCLVTLALFVALPAFAADWPQFRGPNRDDVSVETGLQTQWAADGPSRLWLSKDVGVGYAGFSVVGNALFTMGADGGDEKVIEQSESRLHGENKKGAARAAPFILLRIACAI